MRSEDIQRNPGSRHPRLEMTLFSRASAQERRGEIDALMQELDDVAEALEDAERKLAAIETMEGIDAAAIRAATAHIRLLCRPTGYTFSEADESPPRVGELVEADGEVFVVERHRPSPFPGDARRCVILVRADVAPLHDAEPPGPA
jgi:hypothetical protein